MLGAAYSQNEHNMVDRGKFTALSGHQTPLPGYPARNRGLYELKGPHSRNGMLRLPSSTLQIFMLVTCKFKYFGRHNQAKYYDFLFLKDTCSRFLGTSEFLVGDIKGIP
jgi:hypothetical protein